MTLLAMILVNERNLKGELDGKGDELIKNLEKYRDNWMQKKEQQGNGVWLIIHDGVSPLTQGVFKNDTIEILESDGGLGSVTENKKIANVNLLEFQKNLKDGTTGNTPNVQFRGDEGSSGNSKLAYIKFNEETS